MKRMASGTFARHHRVLWGLFVGLALGANLALADTPRANFGSALITGADNRISVTRVPVIDSTGKVTYRDFTVNFNVSNTGALTLGTPTNNPSPSLITSAFSPGNYKDTRGNTYKLTGPSVIPGTTRTLWSLAFVSGPDAKLFSMSWVTGPVAGHPNEPSLKQRNITSSSYTWGIVGTYSGLTSGFPFSGWYEATVVGAVQAGNQLVLYQFAGNDNIADRSATLTKY